MNPKNSATDLTAPVHSLEEYHERYAASVANPEAYWREQARS